jgi:hypothetical protein
MFIIQGHKETDYSNNMYKNFSMHCPLLYVLIYFLKYPILHRLNGLERREKRIDG